MAPVKFNSAQLSNPTPAGLNRWVRVFTVIFASLIAWMPTNNVVPHNVQDVLTPILALLMTIANGIAPFFGIEVSGKTVPAEDVTAMEQHTPTT